LTRTTTFEDGIVGLLGPNGAGTSTLVQMVATMTKPTSGSLEWCGTDVVDDPSAIRADLGYLPQDFGVYHNLDVDESALPLLVGVGLVGYGRVAEHPGQVPE
jgi:ABC-2 type transport system ATP-binding protein